MARKSLGPRPLLAWLAGALPLLLLASTAAAETSYGVNSLACPANVETIGPDVDLSLPQFSTLNTTYLLRPGSYNITTTISVTNTSFPEGLCYIALEPNVTVYPKVSRSFTFNIGTRLGLQGFVLDGAQADGGVQTVAGSSAQWAAEGMTFQGFTNQAINLLGGTSSLRNCVVQNNSGRSRALVCQGGFTPQPNIVLSLETVSFISNRDFQSSSGGALDVAFSCTATLTGRSTFTNNQANPSGAALRVNDGGRVVIQGPVCSSGNDVFGNGLQNVGKFAQVFGTLELNAPTETMIIREGLSAISVESGSRVQCGSNATTWAAPAPGPNGNIQYAINGEACGCDADFIAGNSTTCNTCDNDPSTCNCKDCLGGGCCQAQAFLTRGTPCRSAEACSSEALCSGIAGGCPAPVLKDNATLFRNGTDCSFETYCDNNNTQCPPPVFKGRETPCRNGTDCSFETYCNGSSPECPATQLKGKTDVCRSGTGCIFDTFCDGASLGCPATPTALKGPCCDPATKTFRPAGELCRLPQGSCEVVTTCTGDAPDCPPVVAVNGKPCSYTQREHFLLLALRASTDYREEPYGRHRDEERRHAGEETPYYRDTPHGLHDHGGYDGSGEDDDDRRSWGDCWGKCFAGQCKLDKHYSGCCYLGADTGSDSRDYGGYAKQEVLNPDGGTTGEVLKAEVTYSPYGAHKDKMVYCWMGEHDKQHY